MSIRNGHARWAFDLSAWRPSRADLLLATSCIQTEEKERLNKFVFRNDFDASLIGRLLMRKFVHDSTGMPYASIRFGRDARGRPHLLDIAAVSAAAVAASAPTMYEHGLDFNVSHQGNFSVLAGHLPAASKMSIGVDVMKIEYTGGKPLAEFFRLMQRNFSTGEWANIRSQTSETAQTKSFMRHWCLKESYVKNIGVGISIDLKSIDFAVRTPELRIDSTTPVTDTKLSVSGERAIGWTFEESLLDDQHSVCVALQREPNDNSSSEECSDAHKFDVISFDELMRGADPLLEADDEYCNEVLRKEYKAVTAQTGHRNV